MKLTVVGSITYVQLKIERIGLLGLFKGKIVKSIAVKRSGMVIAKVVLALKNLHKRLDTETHTS